jgi:hypothetical protein
MGKNVFLMFSPGYDLGKFLHATSKHSILPANWLTQSSFPHMLIMA